MRDIVMYKPSRKHTITTMALFQILPLVDLHRWGIVYHEVVHLFQIIVTQGREITVTPIWKDPHNIIQRQTILGEVFEIGEGQA